ASGRGGPSTFAWRRGRDETLARVVAVRSTLRRMRRLGCLVAAAALSACGGSRVAPAPVAAVSPAPAPAVAPSPAAIPAAWAHRGRAVVAPHGMVATDAALATKVGADTLAAGGNAVDAAVAGAFALAVVLPDAGDIRGGGLQVARRDR